MQISELNLLDSLVVCYGFSTDQFALNNQLGSLFLGDGKSISSHQLPVLSGPGM